MSRRPVGRRNTSLAARERLLLAWRLALEEVASRWDALYAGEDDPPWLDEDWDTNARSTPCSENVVYWPAPDAV